MNYDRPFGNIFTCLRFRPTGFKHIRIRIRKWGLYASVQFLLMQFFILILQIQPLSLCWNQKKIRGSVSPTTICLPKWWQIKPLPLKGVFAKNYRWWSLLILLLSVASIKRKLFKTTNTEERSVATFNSDLKKISFIPNNYSDITT